MSERSTMRHGVSDGRADEAATSAPRTTAVPSWLHTSATPLQAALGGIGQDHIGPAAMLWPTGQDSDAGQRADRYLPQTLRHPQRTRPALTAQAIHRYTRPGQTVFDPFVGVGTTTVEAVYAGRRAIGVDVDPRWVESARLNLGYAFQNGATGAGMVLHADARHLTPAPGWLRDSIDLILTAPPVRLQPLAAAARRCSNADLVVRLETDLGLVFASWIPLVHSGTVIVLTTRLLCRAQQTVDLTVPIAYAARRVGFTFVERVAALRVPIRDAHQGLRPRTQRRGVRPRVVHDDVLVYHA
ncbi:DNA methyltransferase [Actinomycetes bacterium KLBMP 9797]